MPNIGLHNTNDYQFIGLREQQSKSSLVLNNQMISPNQNFTVTSHSAQKQKNFNQHLIKSAASNIVKDQHVYKKEVLPHFNNTQTQVQNFWPKPSSESRENHS